MFTGLVREIGMVKSLQNAKLTIHSKHKAQIGDSIAVNGVCLTVIENVQNGFVLELSEETQKHIALEIYKDLVHIEPAMRLSDRLDGHIVQGHIDGIGEIVAIESHAIGTDFFIKVNTDVLDLCVPKGSIALNGISLTINEVLDSSLRITIIPHTLQTTLFKNYKVHTRINIETDCLARMVRYFMQSKQKNPKLTWEAVDQILGSY